MLAPLVAVATGRPHDHLSGRVLLAALALGLLCTAWAFVLFFQLMAEVIPTSALTVTFLVPVFGVLWGALFLGEPIGWFLLAGLAGILVGVALVTGSLRPEALTRLAARASLRRGRSATTHAPPPRVEGCRSVEADLASDGAPFRQVDVFTTTSHLGNPVAEVLDGEGLTTEELERVTRCTNLSEATFVLPPTPPGRRAAGAAWRQAPAHPHRDRRRGHPGRPSLSRRSPWSRMQSRRLASCSRSH